MSSTWNKDEEIEKSVNEFKKTITKGPFKQYLDKDMVKDLKDKNKQILFCADALYQGYLDACRTFQGQEKISKIKVENKKPVELEKNKLWSIAEDIYEYLCNGNVGGSDKIPQGEFDKKHQEWCERFLKYHGMEYGQAQKIVNMAFKYMYCFWYGKKEYEEYLSKCEPCHMPLDSFSLEWIRRGPQENGYSFKIESTAWSKLDCKEYQACCSQINKLIDGLGITPLQADILVWEKMKNILAAEEFLHTIDNDITYSRVLKQNDKDLELSYSPKDIIKIQNDRFERVKEHIELWSGKQ